MSDLVSVAQQVPGISFKTSGPGQTEFEMRGLTSTGGESPTVGFYLDDVALTPAAMAQNGKTVIDPTLFDLNRVEVLRGPQGTVYGAGSMGGTIKLVSNQPDPNKFDASAELIGSGTDERRWLQPHRERDAEPAAGRPAWSRCVSWRPTSTSPAGFRRDVLDPFPAEVDNSNQRGNVAAAPVAMSLAHSNTERLGSERVQLLIQPNDRLSLNFAAMHQDLDQDGPEHHRQPAPE